jgi:hypothetical protein
LLLMRPVGAPKDEEEAAADEPTGTPPAVT